MMDKDYYSESKRLRKEALTLAESLTNHPVVFEIDKGFPMVVELSKTDIKTMVSKNTSDDKFNAVKNALIQDVKGYLLKAKYVGWRKTVDKKHQETAYFVYFNRKLGANTYMALRRIKTTGRYKPYVIVDQRTYDFIEKYIIKGKPPL